MEFITKVQRNEFHQATSIHERPELKRLSPFHAGQPTNERSPAKLAESRQTNDEQANQPISSPMQEANFSPQARGGKKDWQEQDGANVLKTHPELGSKATLGRNDQTGDKCAKKRVDTEQLSTERSGKNHRHDYREQALGRLGPLDRLLPQPAGKVRLEHKKHQRGKNQNEPKTQHGTGQIVGLAESNDDCE